MFSVADLQSFTLIILQTRGLLLIANHSKPHAEALAYYHKQNDELMYNNKKHSDFFRHYHPNGYGTITTNKSLDTNIKTEEKTNIKKNQNQKSGSEVNPEGELSSLGLHFIHKISVLNVICV